MKFYKLNSKLHSTHNLNNMFFYFYLYFVLGVFDMYNIQTERNRIKIESQSVNQPDSVGVQNQVYLEFIEMLCCLDMEAKIVFQTFFFRP